MGAVSRGGLSSASLAISKVWSCDRVTLGRGAISGVTMTPLSPSAQNVLSETQGPTQLVGKTSHTRRESCLRPLKSVLSYMVLSAALLPICCGHSPEVAFPLPAPHLWGWRRTVPPGAPQNPGGDWSPAMELMPSLLGASGRLVLGSGNWMMGLQGRGGCESQEALVHRGARCRVAAPSWCSSGMTSTTVWP